MEENAFELWKKQKEEQRQKKFREQQEIREMMEKYWPWEHERTKPRGKSNLFEEEIYPVEEFGKVKRVTEIPEVNRPKQVGNKHISYAKRAQGSKDTSATSTKSQNVEIFKKDLLELEKATACKKKNENEHSRKMSTAQSISKDPYSQSPSWKENIGLKFLKSLGWTDNKMLKNIAQENSDLDYYINRKIDPDNPKHLAIREYVKNSGGYRSCSDLPSDGIELVRVLARDRNMPRKYSLSSTDVTKVMEHRVECDNEYCHNLRSQVDERREKIKSSILEDFEKSKQHFNTWDSFWGRPGHGAPLETRKKLRLDALLYPHTRSSDC